MRVCLITEDFHPEEAGAVSILLSQLVRYLCDEYSDVAIDVIASANPADRRSSRLPAFEQWNGVQIFRIDTTRTKQASMVMRLLAGWLFACRAHGLLQRLHRRRPYDLVCVGTNPPASALAARAMKAKYGLPYIYILHDLYPDMAISLRHVHGSHVLVRSARWLQRQWLGNAAAVVVQGCCSAAYVQAHYGIVPGNIRIVENWSDPDAVTPQGKNTAFRGKHGLHGFLAIYAGNLGYAQRIDTILNAAKIVGPKDADITFVLVGGGATADEIDRRIAAEKISNARRFPTVAFAEYSDLLASADVALVSLDPALHGLAVPSKTYSIMAAGRPVVALVDRESEIAVMLRRYDCGVQVDHDDGTALAEAVVTLRNAGTDRLNEMGRRARAALEENYTLKHAGERFHRLMLEIGGENLRVK